LSELHAMDEFTPAGSVAAFTVAVLPTPLSDTVVGEPVTPVRVGAGVVGGSPPPQAASRRLIAALVNRAPARRRRWCLAATAAVAEAEAELGSMSSRVRFAGRKTRPELLELEPWTPTQVRAISTIFGS